LGLRTVVIIIVLVVIIIARMAVIRSAIATIS
jgi:hypothetical protein